MKIIIFLCISIVIVFILFMITRRKFGINIKILISMMFFGGIGFAFGHYFSSGWAIFGAILGALVGIEYKDKFFELMHLVYKDITTD